MSKGFLPLWGLTCLLAMLASCKSEPVVDSPKPGQRDACAYGLPQPVYTSCGCNPRVAALDRAGQVSGLSDNLRQKQAACANLAASAPVNGVAMAASINGCVSQEATLDQDIKKHLIDLDAQYSSTVTQQMLDHWETCRVGHQR